MTFLKPNYSKLLFGAFIFAIVIYFLTPIQVNAICDSEETCPYLIKFVKITDVAKTPNYVNIHYPLAILELVLSYVLVSFILMMSGRGGSVAFIERIT